LTLQAFDVSISSFGSVELAFTGISEDTEAPFSSSSSFGFISTFGIHSEVENIFGGTYAGLGGAAF